MSEPSFSAQKVGHDEVRVFCESPPDARQDQELVVSKGTFHKSSKTINFDRRGKKLYDRSSEEKVLLQAYRRMSEQGRNPEVVVISSGEDGTGKTSLAQTLREHVNNDGGFFVSGKFDQLQRPEPYRAFVSAFTEFTSIVVSRGKESIESIREAINSAIEADTRILVDMIPALEQIIKYDQCEAASMQDTQAAMRFTFVFRMFVKAVCSPERALVLLLDDLHFADQSSLDLFASLISDTDNQGMLIIVTCRENVGPTSPVSQLLRRLEDANVSITGLRVANMQKDTVNAIVSEILGASAEESKHLADFIYLRTRGNVFLVLEFLRSLCDALLLRFDSDEMRWVWDENEIFRDAESCGVGDIMYRMKQQPQPLLEVLKVAACLGSSLDELLLSHALSAPVSQYLTMGAKHGLLSYDSQRAEYSFLSDSVQGAAYSLIPDDSRAFFHVSIGRKLRKNLSVDEVDTNIYTVLNQFRLGAEKITSRQEKYAIAELCLRAGEKAVSASSFPTASIYLDFGRGLLGENHWKEEYELSLALFNTSSEVECCTGNFVLVNALLAAVFENARSFPDKLRAHATEIYVLGATDKMEEALDSGCAVLRELGEPLPSKLMNTRMVIEIAKVRRLTRAKTNEALLRLPLMRNRDKIDAMHTLNLMFLSAYMTRPVIAVFVTLRMVRITLKHGLCAISSVGFALYGMLCCSFLEDIDEGYRFGELSLALLDRFKVKGWLPRVYAGVFGCIHAWKRPFHLALVPLKIAFETGMSSGDMEYAMLDANLYCFTAIDAGKPLTIIESEMRRFCEIMTLQNQESALLLVRPTMRLLQNLMDLADDLVASSGKLLFDQTEVLSHIAGTKNEVSLFAFSYHRMLLAYLFGEYAIASRMAESCRRLEQHPMANMDKCSVAYFDSLASLALASQAPARARRKHIDISRRYITRMKKWARDSPHNCLARLSLVQAEQAAVTGNAKRAYAKYLVAIALSQKEGLLYEECIANERAGRHLLRLDDAPLAASFLQRSHSLYLEWGAHKKARHLKSEFVNYIH